jgi:hypothetical protein
MTNKISKTWLVVGFVASTFGISWQSQAFGASFAPSNNSAFSSHINVQERIQKIDSLSYKHCHNYPLSTVCHSTDKRSPEQIKKDRPELRKQGRWWWSSYGN